jgi:hypothetical protein
LEFAPEIERILRKFMIDGTIDEILKVYR